MNRYNPNIHHRKSIRLKGYDYSQEGLYFITICTHNRACIFGDIVDGKMILNDAGEIAFNEWMKTSELRENIELGEFVVMPNHIHGIINITRRGELHSPNIDVPDNHSPDNHSPNNHSPDNISAIHNGGKRGENISPLRGPSQTVGAIVRGYKSAVTKQIKLLGNDGKGVMHYAPTFVWQRNYYEHIILNQQSYFTISQYIFDNPKNWNADKFYTQ